MSVILEVRIMWDSNNNNERKCKYDVFSAFKLLAFFLFLTLEMMIEKFWPDTNVKNNRTKSKFKVCFACFHLFVQTKKSSVLKPC